MWLQAYEQSKDIRLTTDRIVEIMKKTNVLGKESAEALRKYNETKKDSDRRTDK